jgi:hypothetical protein
MILLSCFDASNCPEKAGEESEVEVVELIQHEECKHVSVVGSRREALVERYKSLAG